MNLSDHFNKYGDPITRTGRMILISAIVFLICVCIFSAKYFIESFEERKNENLLILLNNGYSKEEIVDMSHEERQNRVDILEAMERIKNNKTGDKNE